MADLCLSLLWWLCAAVLIITIASLVCAFVMIVRLVIDFIKER